MKGSRKTNPPDQFLEWLSHENDEWKPTYSILAGDVKESVRSTLHAEQRGLCIYCGRRLNLSAPGKSYHIEHFRPRETYPHLQLDYNNLYLSCGQEDAEGNPAPTCGNVKGNWFDEANHVPTAYAACTQRFKFSLNGDVEAADATDDAANTMIRVLNLNHPELVKDRESVLYIIDSGQLDCEDYLNEDGTAQGCAHVVYQHVNRVLP